MRLRSIAIALCMVLHAANAGADDDDAALAKGRVAWSAFECAALASWAKKPAEQARLFQLGFDAGREFVRAAIEGRIKAGDPQVAQQVPYVITLHMQGPNADFIMGRLWEAALKSVGEGRDAFDDDNGAAIAASDFQKRNCDLVGR